MIKKRYPLQEILDEFGPPQGDSPISRAEAEHYQGRVPDALIEFWLNHGRGVGAMGFTGCATLNS